MTQFEKGKALREAYGKAIVELGLENKNIYVVDCDIGKSCKTLDFIAKCPDQHINVGIAEQNGAGVAAGLATCGKIPFVTTYAVFGSMRMLEQIRQEVCYPHLNVKVACSHGGFTPANDGASHQGIEDYGLYRTIPNMTILVPSDYEQAYQLVKLAAAFNGPVYIRFTRDAIPCIYKPGTEFEIGRAVTLKDGNDVTIISAGDVLSFAYNAAELLEEKGVSVRLIDMHTIKPIDRQAIMKAAKETKGIITVEDHNIINGLGSAVCEVIAECGGPKVKRMGIQDSFGESAPYSHLLEKNGVSIDSIVRNALELLK